MTNRTKKLLKEYLSTIIVTVVVVVLICLFVELNLLFKTEKKVNTKELDVPNLLDFCKIEQLEKRYLKEPKNYHVAVRIAKHYEKLKEYDRANNYYSDAVRASQNSEFTVYSYAMFLARRGMVAYATDLAEKLSILNNKNIKYKANIYNELAKSLGDKHEYEAEVKAYQIAQKYAKNAEDSRLLAEINYNYAKAFIALADYHIKKHDIQSAILDLNNSLKIKELLHAKYKLGLIYLNSDKIKAERYFSEVIAKDVYIVNPYIYNKLLDDLIEISKTSFNTHSTDFYRLKSSKYKRILQDNYVFKNDILINNFHIVEVKKPLSKHKQYIMYFDVNNNTPNKISRLYIQVELFVNNKQYVINDKIVNPMSSISYYDTLKQVKIPLPDDFEFIDIKNQNDVFVKYYAKKRDGAPWTLLKIDSVHF